MLFSEKLKGFAVAHLCREMTADGARFRCVVIGPQRGRTLVLLNGGMNTLEMWMDYAEDLSRDYQVLLFDYPQALKTNQALVQGIPGRRWSTSPAGWIPAAIGWRDTAIGITWICRKP